MSDFDELVDEAERAPIGGWDFGWLEGRAVEARPSWRFFDRVVEHTAGVESLLEVEAGIGAMIGNIPSLPPLAVATEGYAPGVAVASPRLRAAGVCLVVTSATPGLPFAGGVVRGPDQPPSRGDLVDRDRAGTAPRRLVLGAARRSAQPSIAQRVPHGPAAEYVEARP